MRKDDTREESKSTTQTSLTSENDEAGTAVRGTGGDAKEKQQCQREEGALSQEGQDSDCGEAEGIEYCQVARKDVKDY